MFTLKLGESIHLYFFTLTIEPIVIADYPPKLFIINYPPKLMHELLETSLKTSQNTLLPGRSFSITFEKDLVIPIEPLEFRDMLGKVFFKNIEREYPKLVCDNFINSWHTIYAKPISKEDTKNPSLSKLARKLPGMAKMTKSPCQCSLYKSGGPGRIFDIIIHLNDVEKWDRNRIADWLETLDADLEFK